MSVAANKLITRMDECRIGVPIATSTHLYEGTLAFINSSGFLDDDTGSGANDFAGVVVKEYDNSAGGNGDLSGETFIDGIFRLVGSGFSQASVGLRAYATDNYTVTTDPTVANAVPIGTVRRYVSATVVDVDIEPDPLTLPVALQAAYTQTYATAERTVAAATAAALTVTDGAGTNDGTIGAITADASVIAAVQELAAQIAKLVADDLVMRKLINAIIDDLQALKISG